VFITPHNSAYSFPEEIVNIFAENYRLFVTGEPLKYAVDFATGINLVPAKPASSAHTAEITDLKFDGLVKSLQGRNSREACPRLRSGSGSPQVVEFPGFPLLRE